MQGLFWIGLIGAVAYGFYQNANAFIQDLRVNAQIYGIPKISKGNIYLPVKIRIDNPRDLSLKVQQIFGTLFEKNKETGEFEPVANTQPDNQVRVILPRATTEFLLEIRAPWQNAVMQIISAIDGSFNKANFKFKGHIKVEGVELPIETSFAE